MAIIKFPGRWDARALPELQRPLSSTSRFSYILGGLPMTATVGFIVIYRWRLHPEKEQHFQEVWSRNTPLIIKKCGALGSRLHKAEDGTWLAYAQWPDKATWERCYSVPAWDPSGDKLMEEAVIEQLPRILLNPVADFLVQPAICSQS